MKPTLVILPGWGGNCDTWKAFIEIAQSDFNVVCIDLPCFGNEPCPDSIWGVEEYRMFVKSKISELRTPNSELILLGHSFGGQIAVCVAAKHPELIEKLILSGPAIFRPARTIQRLLFGTIAKAGKWIFRLPMLERWQESARAMLYRAAQSPDFAHTSDMKRQIFKKIIRQDMTAILPSIQAPTLLVWGTKDAYVPVGDAEKAKRLIQNATVHLFPNGRHGLHVERPRELYNAIRAFVWK